MQPYFTITKATAKIVVDHFKI